MSRVATSPGASLDDAVARLGAAAVSEDLTTARHMLDRIVEARRAAPARIPRHERAHLFSDPYEGAPDPTKVSSDGEQLADAEPSDADPAAHRRHGGVGGARCSSRPVSADSWPVHREAADASRRVAPDAPLRRVRVGEPDVPRDRSLRRGERPGNVLRLRGRNRAHVVAEKAQRHRVLALLSRRREIVVSFNSGTAVLRTT